MRVFRTLNNDKFDSFYIYFMYELSFLSGVSVAIWRDSNKYKKKMTISILFLFLWGCFVYCHKTIRGKFSSVLGLNFLEYF